MRKLTLAHDLGKPEGDCHEIAIPSSIVDLSGSEFLQHHRQRDRFRSSEWCRTVRWTSSSEDNRDHQPFPTAIDFDAWRNEAENYSHDQGSLLKKHVFRHASERSLAVRIHEFDARQPFLLEPVAAMARCFDLSLIEANSITRQLSEALLFDSGRPLVLFPSSKVSRPVETVAIGWDGRSSMARSVACSGSLLAAATKVFVISITDDKEINLADRELFASSLRWAGLEVEVITVQAGHETAAVALQTVSLEHRADLLIADGFGQRVARRATMENTAQCGASAPLTEASNHS